MKVEAYSRNNLVQLLKTQLFDILNVTTNNQPNSFGFEYEFLPEKVLSIDNMEYLYNFLKEMGFSEKKGVFFTPSNLHIAFEPGGQIEYCSPPIFSDDKKLFSDTLNFIEKTNKAIAQELKINYIGVDYIPNRGDIGLCLLSERYQNLHKHVINSGTRGKEMMKGTASIHLHVRVTNNLDKLFTIYQKLCRLSIEREFCMSNERRDIWNNTDPSRCGLPILNFEKIKDTSQFIENIIRFAINSIDLKEKIQYKMKKDITLNDFLNHLTTIFTDVRLNLKGPTMEMRTLDSMPIECFSNKWNIFVNEFKKL